MGNGFLWANTGISPNRPTGENIFFLGIRIRFELNRSESLEFRTPALPGIDTGFLAVAYKADLHPNRLSIHF